MTTTGSTDTAAADAGMDVTTTGSTDTAAADAGTDVTTTDETGGKKSEIGNRKKKRKRPKRPGKKSGGRLRNASGFRGDSANAMAATTAGGREARRLLHPGLARVLADACTPTHSVPLRTAYGFYTA